MAHGWTKWSADLSDLQSPKAGGGYGGRGWVLPDNRGTASTAANPPVKVVLLVSVGHALDTYPLPGPW